MTKKDICIRLIEKGVKARMCSYWGILGKEGKKKAPLYNRFVHGVRDASVGLGILSLDEAIKAENKASDKYMFGVPESDILPDRELNFIKLPEDDKLSCCSYKYHITKAILIRAISLLGGVLLGYFLSFGRLVQHISQGGL